MNSAERLLPGVFDLSLICILKASDGRGGGGRGRSLL